MNHRTSCCGKMLLEAYQFGGRVPQSSQAPCQPWRFLFQHAKKRSPEELPQERNADLCSRARDQEHALESNFPKES